MFVRKALKKEFMNFRESVCERERQKGGGAREFARVGRENNPTKPQDYTKTCKEQRNAERRRNSLFYK